MIIWFRANDSSFHSVKRALNVDSILFSSNSDNQFYLYKSVVNTLW